MLGPASVETATLRRKVGGVFTCLAVSAASLAAAPMLMPASYSWVTHTTSEAAAQGVEGAWLARFGFLGLGFAVLALCGLARRRWSGSAVWLHASFGVLMIAAAVFSTRSWEPGVAYDAVEDVLHSVAATGLGFAFAVGVAVVAWRFRQAGAGLRWLDVSAVAASVVLPLAMIHMAAFAGLLQRLIFAIAYVWYAVEVAGVLRASLRIEEESGPAQPPRFTGVMGRRR